MKAPMTRAVVGLAALSLGLAGCGGDLHPPYSANIKFGLRKDPVVVSAKDLGEERYDPDRPGLLPIMKFDDALQPDHPYQAKLRLMLAGTLKEILEKQHADFASLSDERKRELENQVLKHGSQHHKEFAAKLVEVLRDPGLMTDKDRSDLEANLEKMFGTPAKPTINAEFAGIEKSEIADLKLDDATLAKGSTRFRIHCMHCHGVPGDGRGPTARWVNPHPRDFRSGLFKFKSVDQTAALEPSRADLLRTLRNGVEGTAMPAFNLLSDDDLESITSYVMFLSLRGQTELWTIKKDLDLDPSANVLKLQEDGNLADSVKVWTKKWFDGWAASNKPGAEIKVAEYPFKPEDLADSVKRGQQIFNATPTPEFKKEFRDRLFVPLFNEAKTKALAAEAKEPKKALTDPEIADIKKAVEASIDAKFNNVVGVKCISCHTDYGRQARFKYDEWGTLARPNNFTTGVFRGGRAPVDIYYRIHSGIQGSEMPPFASNFKGQERYIWDLVNFVRVTSYPAMHKGIELRLEP